MASAIETEVNDLLKFAFSPPTNPGKLTIQKSLKTDWRAVVKAHCNLNLVQVKWLDSLSPAQVDQMRKSVFAATNEGVPKVKLVDNVSGGFTVQRAANNVNNKKNNNVKP